MGSTDKKTSLRFNLKAFLIFIAIFIIEVLIALFVDDKLIRPYGGDYLVVIMIYYFLKSFIDTKPIYLILIVFAFSYGIEICQYFDLVMVLGVQDNVVLRTVIGTSFSWGDLVAYALGLLTCWIVETKIGKRKIND